METLKELKEELAKIQMEKQTLIQKHDFDLATQLMTKEKLILEKMEELKLKENMK